MAFVLVVVPAAFNQFNEIVAGLPPLLDRGREWAANIRPQGLSTSLTAILDSVERQLAARPPDTEEVVEVGLTVAEVLVSLVTLLAVVFFWLLEHARLERFTLAFLPSERRGGAREAWNEIENRLGLWVRGQLILMGTMGVATGLTYTLLGLPSPMLLALIAAVMEACRSSARSSAPSRRSSSPRPSRRSWRWPWPGSTSSSSSWRAMSWCPS